MTPAAFARHRAAARVSAARKYARRKAAGMCTKCGEQAAVPGHIDCEECRAAQRAKTSARHARMREEQRCRCGAPTLRVYCAACGAAKCEQRRRTRAGRYARGLCVECGMAPHEDGKHSCRACLDKESARSKARRVAAILAEEAAE